MKALHRTWTWLTALYALGCTEAHTGVEDNAGADIRVALIFFGPKDQPVQVLAGDDPLEFSLKEPFETREVVSIMVLGYSLARLSEAFPTLAQKNAAEVAQSLGPNLERRGFVPPQADSISFGEVSLGSPDVIQYGAVGAGRLDAELASRGLPPLRFEIPALMGCTPAPLRVFDPQAPARGCRALRNADCSFTFEPGCDRSLASLCEASLQGAGGITQGGLVLAGGAICTRQAAQEDLLGITDQWRCAPGVCGADEQILAAQATPAFEGTFWGPRPLEDRIQPDSQVGSARPNARFARTPKGVVYADQDQDEIRIWRLEVQSGEVSFSRIATPVPLTRTELGSLSAISADRDHRFLVVQGTVTLASLSRPVDGDRNAYDSISVLAPLDLAERVIGELVVGPDSGRIFLPTERGFSVRSALAPSQLLAETSTGPAFLPTAKIRSFAVRQNSGGEAIFGCEAPAAGSNDLCLGSTVHRYDHEAKFEESVTNQGRLLAILDGPTFVLEETPFILAFRGPGAGPMQRFAIPPRSLAKELGLALPQEPNVQLGERTVLALQHSFWMGMLDVDSGQSEFFRPTPEVAAGEVPVIFENVEGNGIYALLVADRPTEIVVFELPALLMDPR